MALERWGSSESAAQAEGIRAPTLSSQHGLRRLRGDLQHGCLPVSYRTNVYMHEVGARIIADASHA
jgi:hypothetical protein